MLRTLLLLMTSPVLSQPSQVGEALWRARTRLGLTIEDVAKTTGFAALLLTAIEDSDFAEMRSNGSTIAAAKSYAVVARLPKGWVARTLAAELKAGPGGKSGAG